MYQNEHLRVSKSRPWLLKRSFGAILGNESLIMDSPFYFYFIFYGENNSSKKQRQMIVFIVLMILP